MMMGEENKYDGEINQKHQQDSIKIYPNSNQIIKFIKLQYWMAEFYQYTKARKDFGRPCNFSDTKPISTVFLPFEPKKKEESYVLRNPNFIQLDNLTDNSFHQVNTKRVTTGEKGMFHKEGGWPDNFDPTEQQQYNRFMKKIDKDQSFASQVKNLCEISERTMLTNNQIDMFEQYFVGEESDYVTESIKTKTTAILKDPSGICKRGVSEISYHTENMNKIAASYCINRFQQTPDKMKTDGYMWDLNYPNEPQINLESPSSITNISFNHKLTDLIGGGCSNGLVCVWDSRKGKQPVAISHPQITHSDPVTHFQWQMTKTGQQCVSSSTDGSVRFWDIRKLKQEVSQSLVIKENIIEGEQTKLGVTALENSSETPTKFILGTELGTVIIANKRPKKPVEISLRLGMDNRHLGPVTSIARNLQFSKIFMTMGDWSAKIWMDDIRTPLITTKFHDSYITDGCFAPQRMGAFFLTRKDGWLDAWDFYYRQNQVAFSHKVSSAPLNCIKINYSGTGNQITGGKIAAIGDEDGTITILELSESFYTPQKNEKQIMPQIFGRQMVKQKNLQAIRRAIEIRNKRVPVDTNAAQKKLQIRVNEQIAKIDDKFDQLFKDLQQAPNNQSPPKQDKKETKQQQQNNQQGQ